jgi:hypothetical protein
MSHQHKSNLWRFRVALFTCLVMLILVLTLLTSGIAQAGQAPGGSHNPNSGPTPTATQ